MKTKLFIIFFSSLFVLASCSSSDNDPAGEPEKEYNLPELDYNTFCFYYDWHGNEEFDGSNIHWAHAIEPKPDSGESSSGTIPGTEENLASNFYPQLGRYSNNDVETVRKHVDMLAQAKIGVIALTWWNEGTDKETNKIAMLLDEANKKNLKVCFHLEPYVGRNVDNIKENIAKLISNYGTHPAFYKNDGKPLFFVYDSYLISAEEWARILSPTGSNTIRNTANDALMIGLWTTTPAEQKPFILNSHFDGFYTYFAAMGFTYGSTPTNWDSMQKWALDEGKLFIPSVAPGYVDTRVRPWNNSVTRDRNGGVYYDAMYRKAIEVGVSNVSITSFNEWHEGTQIEPAIPFSGTKFTYLDYGSLDPNFYLKRTAYWVEEYQKSKLDEN